MASKKIIFWEVDAQEDFMTPGGKLYVPGAEKLLPNIRRLTDAARRGHVLLVSHGCIHTEDDPEFAQFPPHCVGGTPGAKLVPDALAENHITIPNEASAKLPADLHQFHQIVLEKQTLDIFESRHAEKLLEHLLARGGIYCVWSSDGILRAPRRQRLAGTRTARLDR